MKIPYNPSDPKLKNTEKYRIHAGTVYDHILSALRQSISKDPLVNISCLLHDVAKATTEGVDEEGQPTFHGHESANVDIINKIADRLKFSNEERNAILFAAQNHMHKFPEMRKSKVVAMRQNPNWNILKQTMYADKAARGQLFNKELYDNEMQYIDDLFAKFGEKEAFEKKMQTFVDGRKIMELRPNIKGAAIGVIKNAARDYIIQKDFQVTPEEVERFIKNYKSDYE